MFGHSNIYLIYSTLDKLYKKINMVCYLYQYKYNLLSLNYLYLNKPIKFCILKYQFQIILTNFYIFLIFYSNKNIFHLLIKKYGFLMAYFLNNIVFIFTRPYYNLEVVLMKRMGGLNWVNSSTKIKFLKTSIKNWVVKNGERKLLLTHFWGRKFGLWLNMF